MLALDYLIHTIKQSDKVVTHNNLIRQILPSMNEKGRYMKSHQKITLLQQRIYCPISYEREMKYSMLLYKNGISGKKSATHIIYRAISCIEVQNKAVFARKSFSSTIFTSGVYYSIKAIHNKLPKKLLVFHRKLQLYKQQHIYEALYQSK